MNRTFLFIVGCTAGIAGAAFGQSAEKPASVSTIAAQRALAKSLPADDGRDAAFAARGFIASLSDPLIKAKDGKVVWNLDAYGWMKDGAIPETVNPSLWRHMDLLRKHGLFAVSEGVWQVRGFDVSNMTVIKGQSGWILIDPLTTRETAGAALRLVKRI